LLYKKRGSTKNQRGLVGGGRRKKVARIGAYKVQIKKTSKEVGKLPRTTLGAKSKEKSMDLNEMGKRRQQELGEDRLGVSQNKEAT